MTGPMFVGGGRGRGGGRSSGRGFGGGRGRGSGGRGGAPGGGGAKRPRSVADDELGENYDGFGGGGDAFANKAAMRNDKFDEYYTRQGVVPTAEWETMMASFRTPLPLTFRVNMSGKFRESTRHKLERDLFPKMRLEVPGMAPPKCLAWYPDRLAWQIDIPKDALKKSERLRELHAFMVRANEVGALTRQEAVSMIPPLLLKVKPSHRVLDLCAAPGSKTFQLLEMLHAKAAGRGGDCVPSGVVVANDASLQRANLLTHQTKRSNSPALVVTNHQAQKFPTLYAAGEERPLRFDRILADVPCSGDGTLRKSPDLWKKWSPASGVDLHPLQLEIAERAARMLEVGGRLVYSTCSLNPLENEAVVAALLTRSRGALKLADVSGELEGLRRRPGMHDWEVGDVFGWHASPNGGGRRQRNLAETMWPPGVQRAREMKLERCVRIMPHLDDTGGFFIVAVDKVAELPGDPEGGPTRSVASPGAGSSAEHGRASKDNKGKSWNESNRVAPVIPVAGDALAESMRTQYGLSDGIAISEHLMTRRAGEQHEANPKRLYYVSDGARKLLSAEGGGGGGGPLQVVAAGVKAFERQVAPGSACDYRITQEGLGTLLSRLTKQIVRASPAEVEAVLGRQQGEPMNAEAQKKDLLRPVDAPEGCWEQETLAAMKHVTPGCVVLVTSVSGREKSGARDEADRGDARASKKAKKEKKEKKERRKESEGRAEDWSGPARPDDLAVACWLGEGEKGKSLSVLATKAEGGHLLHQLRDAIGKA